MIKQGQKALAMSVFDTLTALNNYCLVGMSYYGESIIITSYYDKDENKATEHGTLISNDYPQIPPGLVKMVKCGDGKYFYTLQYELT